MWRSKFKSTLLFFGEKPLKMIKFYFPLIAILIVNTLFKNVSLLQFEQASAGLCCMYLGHSSASLFKRTRHCFRMTTETERFFFYVRFGNVFFLFLSNQRHLKHIVQLLFVLPHCTEGEVFWLFSFKCVWIALFSFLPTVSSGGLRLLEQWHFDVLLHFA